MSSFLRDLVGGIYQEARRRVFWPLDVEDDGWGERGANEPPAQFGNSVLLYCMPPAPTSTHNRANQRPRPTLEFGGHRCLSSQACLVFCPYFSLPPSATNGGLAMHRNPQEKTRTQPA